MKTIQSPDGVALLMANLWLRHKAGVKQLSSNVCMVELPLTTYPGYEFHCTLAASRRCLDIPSHQLHLSAAACGYDMTNHHHALCDAEACAAIALKA